MDYLRNMDIPEETALHLSAHLEDFKDSRLAPYIVLERFVTRKLVFPRASDLDVARMSVFD